MMSSKYILLGLFAIGATAQTTCTAYSAPAGACPTAYDSCCNFLCQEAQVPFSICQETDGTGTFATCSACPGALTTTVTSTSSPIVTTTITSLPTDTATVFPDLSTTTLTSTTTVCSESVTGNYTSVLPTPTYISGATGIATSAFGVIGILFVILAL